MSASVKTKILLAVISTVNIIKRIFGSMEDKTNVIKIQRYHSPCGDLMLGSFEDKLCLCDWAAESHRDIVDRRLRKVLKAG